MFKKILAISSILLASLVAVVAIKGDAINFAKSLKGTDIKAEPVKQEKPIMLARVCGQCDCF
jgi:hypothetical protein